MLLKSDRWRQTLDGVHLGNACLIDEAPRIGRHGLEVPPLGFRIQGAERQRRLSRPRDTGEHHQRITWNIHVHVLEIVFACSANLHVLVSGVRGFR